jgi:hypothetical protein
MPFVTCRRCTRFYVIDREDSDQCRCPECSRPMQPAPVEEALRRIRAVPPRSQPVAASVRGVRPGAYS